MLNTPKNIIHQKIIHQKIEHQKKNLMYLRYVWVHSGSVIKRQDMGEPTRAKA